MYAFWIYWQQYTIENSIIGNDIKYSNSTVTVLGTLLGQSYSHTISQLLLLMSLH